MAAVHHVGRIESRVIAQVVEAGLFRRHVGDVGTVGAAPGFARQAFGHCGALEAECPVERPHPRRIARGEIVVRREDVDALAGQGVKDCRCDCGERLPLTCSELHEAAPGQRYTRGHLDVERTQAESVLRERARDGEDGWQERIERFAFGPRSKVPGPPGQGRQRQAGNVYGGDGCDRLEIGSNVVLDAIACRTAVALAPLVGARPVRRVGHPFECTLEANSYQLSAFSWIPEQIAGSSRSHVRSRDNGAAATDSGVTSY